MASLAGVNMKKLVLVGGGHAHLHVLKELRHTQMPDVQVTLISADRYQYYSGMFSGYVEGLYGLDDIRIDLVRLCEAANIEYIQDRIEKIDPDGQEVFLSQGVRLGYDVISFNVGSLTANTTIPGVDEHALLIKPNHMISRINDISLTNGHLVVVGGGASGVEISLSLQAKRKAFGHQTPVTLISSGRLMEGAGKRVSTKIKEIIHNKGIRLIQNDPVVAINGDKLHLQSGNTAGYDQLIWLTGPAAQALFRNSGIPVDRNGYMLVTDNLASAAYPNIFGAGDCITLKSNPSLHKAGVYAVREAPILWLNLQSYLSNRQLQSYRPQSRYLSILSTGEEEALLLYGGKAFHGKWCWRLKRRIDQAFIQRYCSNI